MDVDTEVEGGQAEEGLLRVRQATRDFFVSAVTSTKHGLVFHDPSGGTSGTNNNHLLIHLLQAFPKPWEDPVSSEIVVKADYIFAHTF